VSSLQLPEELISLSVGAYPAWSILSTGGSATAVIKSFSRG